MQLLREDDRDVRRASCVHYSHYARDDFKTADGIEDSTGANEILLHVDDKQSRIADT